MVVLKILTVLLALGALVGLGLVVGAWLRSRRRAEEFAARVNEVAVRVRFVPPDSARPPVVTAEQRFESLRKTALESVWRCGTFSPIQAPAAEPSARAASDDDWLWRNQLTTIGPSHPAIVVADDPAPAAGGAAAPETAPTSVYDGSGGGGGFDGGGACGGAD